MGFSASEDLGCKLSWEAPLCPLGGCSREPSFSLLEGILYGMLSQDGKICQGQNVEVNICHCLSGPSVGSLSYVTATRQIRLACQVLRTYPLAERRCQLCFPIHRQFCSLQWAFLTAFLGREMSSSSKFKLKEKKRTWPRFKHL